MKPEDAIQMQVISQVKAWEMEARGVLAPGEEWKRHAWGIFHPQNEGAIKPAHWEGDHYVKGWGGNAMAMGLMPGVPDIMHLYLPIAIELKAPGKHLEPAQEIVLRQLHEIRTFVYIFDTSDAAINALTLCFKAFDQSSGLRATRSLDPKLPCEWNYGNLMPSFRAYVDILYSNIFKWMTEKEQTPEELLALTEKEIKAMPPAIRALTREKRNELFGKKKRKGGR